MKTERPARIQDLVGILNALYPPAFAESWDNVGLHIGDPAAPLNRVLLCLDPSEMALNAARAAGAEAILTHHPLIFNPLKNITSGNETGRLVLAAARAGIAVICAHTNLDRAPNGLNDWLAALLGVPAALPLAAGDDALLKLVVFVPAGYEDTVAEAMFKGGAGQIGGYDRCSFQSAGIGTFRPGEKSRPFLGRSGEMERASEVRLETIVPRHRLHRTLENMRKAHPYEEVAYDLLPLSNQRPDMGLGRIGRLPEATTLELFAERVKTSLGAASLRLVGEPQARIAKVALCGGSGASLLAEAIRQGADVLVTGDLKYHEARSAQAQGLALIDAGHFATEHLMVRGLAQVLRDEIPRRGLAMEIIEMEGETEPFRVF
ncbi:MAG: Nif3-like dinuclear metal center hexameric protein [Desulfuromonadales bacterium]